MKIVVFEATPLDQERLSQFFKEQNHQLIYIADKLSIDIAKQYDDAEVISVFVGSMVTKEVIDSFPQLKLIATRSTGYDHIDCAHAQSKGIAVASVPAYGSRTVAEFTFALMLTLSRKVYDACRQVRESADLSPTALQGFDLQGKILGVVGTGKIGKNVIRIARGFAMSVLAYDVYPDSAFAQEQGFSYVALEQLLAQSDIVTLHTPYMPQTHHLIDKDKLKIIKHGAYLINTARGELIETEALVAALSSGQLAGAGLDVLEGERELREEAHLIGQATTDFKMLLADHQLMRMTNVIVTPHMAFNSKEALEEILKTTADNIQAYIKGAPQNLVKA